MQQTCRRLLSVCHYCIYQLYSTVLYCCMLVQYCLYAIIHTNQLIRSFYWQNTIHCTYFLSHRKIDKFNLEFSVVESWEKTVIFGQQVLRKHFCDHFNAFGTIFVNLVPVRKRKWSDPDLAGLFDWILIQTCNTAFYKYNVLQNLSIVMINN